MKAKWMLASRRGRNGGSVMQGTSMRTAGVVAALACALAAALPVVQASAADSEAGEVWATSQGDHRLFVVHGLRGQGGVETFDLPFGTGPHLINFSRDGEYAYVSGMGNGRLLVVRADDRQVVATLSFGIAAGTHQAMPSPDGGTLLVAQIPSRRLIKVAADEASETWTPTGQELTFGAKSPICTIFRDDGLAYVSLLPSGIQAVDVTTMTKVGDEIPTDGFVACGMVKERDGGGIMLASTGGGGHVYRLDFATGTLESRGTLGASDWHSFRMSPNEKLGFGTVPIGDEVRLIDLTSDPVTSVALPLDPTAGAANDEPDHMAVRGNTLYATLRESGTLAIVQLNQGTVDYVNLALANPGFNPMNCAGCGVHGVAIRP
jgi:DNA-binding beta-propeller fold protein YncE